MTAMEVIGSHVDQLGECPLWDARTAALWWVDVDGKAIRRLGSDGLIESRSTPGRPGSIALTPDPDLLLVAMEHELVTLRWTSDDRTYWIELEDSALSNRLNDGGCDPAGRFWVGSMSEDGDAPTGMLHRVDAAGHEIVRSGIRISNGIAFAPDGRTGYFADSPTRTVRALDLDPDDGSIVGERVLTNFVELPGYPDGACVDADGCYWTACVFGSALARIAPTGRVDRLVDLPIQTPTMPAFGGEDLSMLFVTSIGGGATFEAGRGSELNGRLLALDVGVTGTPEPVFAGPERSNPV